MRMDSLEGEKLYRDLVRVINLLRPTSPPTRGVDRLRLAVTQEELDAIKAYALTVAPHVEFVARLGGIPVVVEQCASDILAIAEAYAVHENSIIAEIPIKQVDG